MKFTAADYYETAQERLQQAVLLHEQREYALCHYCAGLSVECILRAYRTKVDPQFDARHNLVRLTAESGILDLMNAEQAERFGATVTKLFAWWSNDDRFASDTKLRQKLKQLKADRGIRGDFLKTVTSQALESAHQIVHTGVRLWTRQR